MDNLISLGSTNTGFNQDKDRGFKDTNEILNDP